MTDAFAAYIKAQLDDIRSSGLWKPERVLDSPQSARVRLHGGAEDGENPFDNCDHAALRFAANAAVQWRIDVGSVVRY